MVDEWAGCYDGSWKDVIVPEAFSHPAKVSFGLAKRIYEHAEREGWLSPGQTVIDPFGGIGGFAFHAMQRGLNWCAVELEPRFVDLGQQNINLWMQRYAPHFPGWGTARILQGDSRELAKVIQQAGCCVSSPPYAESIQTSERGSGIDYSKVVNGGHNRTAAREAIATGYGSIPGQLGAMRATGFEAAVGSPPFEKSETGGAIPRDKYPQIGGHIFGYREEHQGCSEGQLSMQSGLDFWSASRTILEQVYSVLAPGGHAIWVVKAFVKGGKRVDFPGQWRQLCEAVGFVTLHEHHALLVKDKGTQFDLEGNGHSKRVERKSFFRRLAEKKGSPRIDWEVVLCMVKPGDGAGWAGAVVSSPPYAEISPEKSGPGIDIEKQWQTYHSQGGGMSLEKFKAQQERHSHGYGTSDGNLGNLRATGDGFEKAVKG